MEAPKTGIEKGPSECICSGIHILNANSFCCAVPFYLQAGVKGRPGGQAHKNTQTSPYDDSISPPKHIMLRVPTTRVHTASHS